jgi:hypothetical protein
LSLPGNARFRAAKKFRPGDEEVMMNGLVLSLIAPRARTGWQFLGLIGCLAFSTSCSTISFGRFHEENSANLILHFYGWDSIYMTRPDTRQDGFLPLLSRAEVERELKQRVLVRDLAVVVIGNTYPALETAQIADEWKQILAAQGFHRVVFLRAGEGDGLDGLSIIEDYTISSAPEPQGRAAGPAALAPGTGSGSVR